MWYKPYGSTGKEISVVSFGGMRFANPQDIDANAEVVLHAYRRGVNFFDTAPGYCADKSELIVGAAVKQMAPGTFHVSTKSNHADGGKLRESLEVSLKRLNVERIHFFHIWCVYSLDVWRQRLAGGAVDAAVRAKQEGLIEHLAISSHMPGEDLRQVLADGPFEGVLLGYCAINFPYRDVAVRAGGEMNLGVVTMNPLGGGVIPRNAERFAFLKGPGDPSVVAAALRFNVSNPAITAALVGCTTARHVDEAVDAVEHFTPHKPEQIERIREKLLDSFDGLCTGCGYCLPCPEGIPVPKMMDAYNLKLLSKEGRDGQILSRLKWHWSEDPAAAEQCTECGECAERCTQHLPVPERMKELAAIARRARDEA